MKQKTENRASKNLAVVLAVWISFCYVFGPLQYEMASLAHWVSHEFEMPQQLLTHNQQEVPVIQHSTDNTSAKGHSHSILEMLKSNWDTQDGTPVQGPTKELKLDKHTVDITFYRLNFETDYPITNKFFYRNSNPQRGFGFPQLQPPQV